MRREWWTFGVRGPIETDRSQRVSTFRWSTLTQAGEEVADANRIVTVCPRGEANVQAARLIAADEGFDGRVESLAGGLEAWDGPIETGQPSQPSTES